MISYSREDLNICQQLFEVLSSISQLSVMLDIQNHKYFWNETVEMIRTSDVILVFQSKEYFQSRSCRQELEFARGALEKPIIFVSVDQNFTAEDWLVAENVLSFDQNDLIATSNEILTKINEIFSFEIPLIEGRRQTSDLRFWNKEQIRKWFDEQNLLPIIYEFYRFETGNELRIFAEALLKTSWLKEYERIKLRITKDQTVSAHEFHKFVNALERIVQWTNSNGIAADENRSFYLISRELQHEPFLIDIFKEFFNAKTWFFSSKVESDVFDVNAE